MMFRCQCIQFCRRSVVTFDISAVGIEMTCVDSRTFIDVLTYGAIAGVAIEADTVETALIIKASGICIAVVQVPRSLF